MSDQTKKAEAIIAFLNRVRIWDDGYAEGQPKAPDLHDTKEAAEELIDDIDWIEKGLAEWRAIAIQKGKEAEAVRATYRIAIAHLQAVLNKARTHAEQQAADTAARDWLTSIGSEP